MDSSWPQIVIVHVLKTVATTLTRHRIQRDAGSALNEDMVIFVAVHEEDNQLVGWPRARTVGCVRGSAAAYYAAPILDTCFTIACWYAPKFRIL